MMGAISQVGPPTAIGVSVPGRKNVASGLGLAAQPITPAHKIKAIKECLKNIGPCLHVAGRGFTSAISKGRDFGAFHAAPSNVRGSPLTNPLSQWRSG